MNNQRKLASDLLLREIILYINESDISNGIKIEWTTAIAEAKAALAAPQPEPLTDAKVSELRSQNGWAKETIRAIERAIREAK
jgi:hypothetical protein